jgi:hypothetical protein
MIVWNKRKYMKNPEKIENVNRIWNQNPVRRCKYLDWLKIPSLNATQNPNHHQNPLRAVNPNSGSTTHKSQKERKKLGKEKNQIKKTRQHAIKLKLRFKLVVDVVDGSVVLLLIEWDTFKIWGCSEFEGWDEIFVQRK